MDKLAKVLIFAAADGFKLLPVEAFIELRSTGYKRAMTAFGASSNNIGAASVGSRKSQEQLNRPAAHATTVAHPAEGLDRGHFYS